MTNLNLAAGIDQAPMHLRNFLQIITLRLLWFASTLIYSAEGSPFSLCPCRMRWLKRWRTPILTGTGPGFSSEIRNHDVPDIFTHSCLSAFGFWPLAFSRTLEALKAKSQEPRAKSQIPRAKYQFSPALAARNAIFAGAAS
jgi:hypothetical protein